MPKLQSKNLDAVCAQLAAAVERLLQQPKNTDMEMAVCLASRSVDTVFFTDSLFAETVNPAELKRVSELLVSAKDALTAGGECWQSVVNRIHEIEDFSDRLIRGELLENTTHIGLVS